MNEKIESYFAQKKLGRIETIEPTGLWLHGNLYHIKTKRWGRPNEFTVYELNGEIKTVRSLQTNKIY
ncbi:MAG: hypothetical protein RR385_09305 [Clostridiales bacterium]